MPSNQLPADLRARVYRKLGLLGFRQRRLILDAIAPLIIEWARKDQAKVDARIAENWADANEVGGYARAAYTVARKLRAQFIPETTGGK